MTSFAITNATVVLPDDVLECGTVWVTDGRIQELREGVVTRHGSADTVIDAAGALLLPGVIDLHNDSLEFEVNPRAGANLPLPFAFDSLERRLAAAGVTTEFHAIAFLDRPSVERSVSVAAERSAYIAQLGRAGGFTIDHFVLHRVDVWSPHWLDAVFASLEQHSVRYLSLNDHTPGQGQFRDVEALLRRNNETAERRGGPKQEMDDLRRRMAERNADKETVPAVYQRIKEFAARMPAVVASHDDDYPEKVDMLYELGARVAEFPITVETARRAREKGMSIIVGAPNIVRGGSQSGNLAAAELLAEGLVDAICADYHAPSVLASVFRVVRDGYCTLPQAVRMATLNAARAVGLSDRGAIEPGLRADLVLVRLDSDGFPRVEAAYSNGRLAFAFARYAGTGAELALSGSAS